MALVYGFLLPADTAIHKTLKRAFNWTFTFDQSLSKGKSGDEDESKGLDDRMQSLNVTPVTLYQ
eukprot:3868288-Ditylum_brightwellii.AAC.1